MSLKYDSLKKFRKEKAKMKFSSPEEFQENELRLMKELYQQAEPTIRGQVRISGGKAKNLLIDIPKKTRPLTDRMKVTLFDIIREDIKDTTILDLYAGSGSFGFEALSRGAKEATFVDASKHAEGILNDNARKTGFLVETHTIRAKVEDELPKMIEEGFEYEIIFMDPPYKLYNTKRLFRIEEVVNAAKQLLPGYKDMQTKKFPGVIIMKHPRKYPINNLKIPGMKILETHDFGLNSLTFWIFDVAN